MKDSFRDCRIGIARAPRSSRGVGTQIAGGLLTQIAFRCVFGDAIDGGEAAANSSICIIDFDAISKKYMLLACIISFVQPHAK